MCRNGGMDMNVAQMSQYGGVIILLIAIVRTLWRDKLPGKVFSILWIVALVRLLLPFSVPSPVSIYTLFEKCRPILEDKAKLLLEQWEVEASMQTVEDSLILQFDLWRTKPYSFWQAIWLAGILVCAVCFAFIYFRCYREFKTALPVENAYIRDWKGKHSLRRKMSVRQSDRITSPLTYGICKPVILMPTSTKWEEENQVSYILEHEYVHIQRWDVVFKLLMITVLCLHWFNPLVWLMYQLFNRDLELSCDETVIHRFGKNSKKEYALALLEMAEKQRRMVSVYCSFGKHPIEERINLILKGREVTRVSGAMAVVFIVGIVLTFTTSADVTRGDNSQIVSSVKRIERDDLAEQFSVNEQQISDINLSATELEFVIKEETFRKDKEIDGILEKIKVWLAENGNEVVLNEEILEQNPEILKELEKLEELTT